MVWIDYAIIGLIAISTLISLVRGFVKEALSLVVWATAFFIASQFYLDLAAHLGNIEEPMLRNAAAIAILFVSSIILGSIVNYIVGQLVQKSGLSGTDRVLGLAFGGLRGILIVAAVLFFMDAFTPASKAEWWSNSLLIPEFSVVIEWFFEYLKHSSSFLKDIKPV
ncbi:CvpA family protein [Catenovulum maritimum]|uniref:Bacteriocin production protein n=1 Tax=Catenovulum maritimum TaxID=1513271 RepID=A0A0J8JPU0_9ALTE|nr:CvpA family protein [Catenovulum maritimum]KMT66696.1 bacteriocin production protein [Catenovulum maritimum]